MDNKVNENNIKELMLEDLEKANGGGQSELSSLVEALSSNMLVSSWSRFGAFMPGAGNAIAPFMENYLKDLGIKAEISVGFCGIGSSPNKYTNIKTGEAMTHDQVLKIVEDANK